MSSLGAPDKYGRRPAYRTEMMGRARRNELVVLASDEWLQGRRYEDSYWL